MMDENIFYIELYRKTQKQTLGVNGPLRYSLIEKMHLMRSIKKLSISKQIEVNLYRSIAIVQEISWERYRYIYIALIHLSLSWCSPRNSILACH